MDQTMPKVSVIIPVYNAEENLRQCIESVVNQTLKDIEIICVDDGSTDRSLEILREYEAKDERLHVLTQKNQYANVARNHGMEQARGEYYAFLDADDFYAPDALKLQSEDCDRYMLEVLKTSFYYVEPDKEPYETLYSTNATTRTIVRDKVMSREGNLRELLSISDVPWNGMYRASFVNKYSLQFNSLFCADGHSFYISCISHARRVMVTGQHTVFHRINHNLPLDGTRYKNYQYLFESYYVVKEIVRELPKSQQRQILQKELRDVLSMSNRIQTFLSVPDKEQIQKQIERFIATYDINDVGTQYIFTMPDNELFYQKKSEYIEKKNDYDVKLQCNQPKVSVIIPVYNKKDNLCECLDSILKQSLKGIEIVCIDDGSTDGSLDVLHEYEKKDDRIVVLSKENEGAGPTRTLGIQVARGEYVAFMDGDDYYPDNSTLEKLYLKAKEYNVFICGGSLCIVDDDKKITDFSINRNWGYTFPTDALMLYEDYQFDYGFSRFIYKRQFLLDNELFFPDYRRVQDPPFFTKAMSLAKQFYAIHDLTYCYRKSTAFFTITQDKRKVCDCLRGYADVLDTARLYHLNELYSLVMGRVFEGGWQFVEAAEKIQEPGAKEAINSLTDAIDLSFLDSDMEDIIVDRSQKLRLARELLLAEKSGRSRKEICTAPEKKTVVFGKRYYEADKPIVTVVIPVYNVELYLKECLDSIVDQTLKNIEIICVNDGSTDNSPLILKEYQKKDSRITIISQANGGLSAARNSGIKYAQGKYICFIDSDDCLDVTALEKLSSLAEENNLDGICFGIKPFYESKEIHTRQAPYDKYYGKEPITGVHSGVEYLKETKNKGSFLTSACRTLWRRALLSNYKIWFKEGIIHEDGLFTFQMLMAADRVLDIPERFYQRRIRDNSIMTVQRSSKNVIGAFTCAAGVLAYMNRDVQREEKDHEICRAFREFCNVAKSYYSSILPEEQAKVVFPSEIENELFQQIVVSGFDLDCARKDLDCARKDLDCARKDLDCAQYDLDSVHSSLSFRIGRAITWMPRKLRGGVRCWREHGVRYTICRFFDHLKGRS